MIVLSDLVDLARHDSLAAERTAWNKWASDKPDLESGWQAVEVLVALVKEGKHEIADISLVLTYALASFTAHPGLSRATTVTQLPASTQELSVYADYESPFEASPAPPRLAVGTPAAKDKVLISLATKLVEVVENVYLRTVAQAEAHRVALCATVQGMQLLGHVLRAYAVALMNVLVVPSAGVRCAGFLQTGIQGLAHRPTALSVAHATLLHVARQAHLPAVALRLLRPVLNQDRVGGMRPLPVILDVDAGEAGVALHDFAAFYVEAGLFCAAQGLWAEAVQCVYNVVALHEGECFGSTWNGTQLEDDVEAALTVFGGQEHGSDSWESDRYGGLGAKGHRSAAGQSSNDTDDSDDVDHTRVRRRRLSARQTPVDTAYGSRHAGSSRHRQSRSLGVALPLETRVAPISLRGIPSTRPLPPCPSRVEVALAFDLYVQAIKLCYVFLIIAHGGGQPTRVLELLDQLQAAQRRTAPLSTTTNAPSAASSGAALRCDEDISDPRGEAINLGDPSQGLYCAADNADFTRSHMDIASIVLAGTRIDAFTTFRGASSGESRVALQDVVPYPATASLLAHLGPYRTLLRSAARRDFVSWTRTVRQLDAELVGCGQRQLAALLVTATVALRRHALIDLAHTYEAVYLRDVLLRISTHPSDRQPHQAHGSDEATASATTARTTDVNEVEAALQLLRETHEMGLLEFRLERPEAALEARDPGRYVVYLSIPSLTLPSGTGGLRPPHGFFCLAPRLHEVDLKPSLIDKVEYLQNLRDHLARVKEIDFMRWQAANARGP